MLTKFWEQNKRFLLITGGGLAVFLLLNALIGSYVHRADKSLTRASQLERDIRELKKELSLRFWQEKTRLADYETHEQSLRKELELPPEKELASFDASAPLLQFNAAVNRVWGEATEQANRAGVALPEKLSSDDFGIESRDGRELYEQYYDYLAVARRGLDVLVGAGMTEIQKPALQAEEDLPIRLNDKVVCRLRPVSFTVSGPFESFLRALKGVQAAGSFLQVRLMQLGPKRGDDRVLQGTVQFAGIRLVEASEADVKNMKPKSKVPIRRKKK
jgi:hypothetical protein